jgi:hypothetical protein
MGIFGQDTVYTEWRHRPQIERTYQSSSVGVTSGTSGRMPRTPIHG